MLELDAELHVVRSQHAQGSFSHSKLIEWAAWIYNSSLIPGN